MQRNTRSSQPEFQNRFPTLFAFPEVVVDTSARPNRRTTRVFYPKPEHIFPKVRFLGLISPVGQIFLPFTRLEWGWEKDAPQGVANMAQALEGDWNNFLYPETSMGHASIPAGHYHEQYFRTDDHPSIGVDPDVLQYLLEKAQQAGVPLKFTGTLDR